MASCTIIVLVYGIKPLIFVKVEYIGVIKAITDTSFVSFLLLEVSENILSWNSSLILPRILCVYSGLTEPLFEETDVSLRSLFRTRISVSLSFHFVDRIKVFLLQSVPEILKIQCFYKFIFQWVAVLIIFWVNSREVVRMRVLRRWFISHSSW